MAKVEPSGTGESPTAVVGIGASAGGLAALEELVTHLVPCGLAYVVLQHLPPDHDDALTALLGRKSPLPVVTAVEGAALQKDVVHVVPPGVDAEVVGGKLRLHPLGPALPRSSIDGLFRSLALSLGKAAIGVVLSGSGSDGTNGLRTIRANGGVTFVQQPGGAIQAGMPTSAVEAEVADFCLAPAEIATELGRLRPRPATPMHPSYAPEVLEAIFDRLRQTAGVDFSNYKPSTIERRIQRRMGVLGIDQASAYLAHLEAHADEAKALYADLLIGVTSFFRDGEPFEALKTVVFPQLFEGRGLDAPLRIWVPGCSTGEEAYSIAICLLEFLDGRPAHPITQIFATDIDDEALATARQAIYPQGISLDVSAARLQRFFVRQEHGYQVNRTVRDMVVFARHNLGKDPPFSRLDLISCRNVLIYLQPALQKKVLRTFHYALNPAGFLLLGTSESVGEADLFSVRDRRLMIAQRKNVVSRPVFDFSAPLPRVDGRMPLEPLPPRPTVSLQQLADRKVLDRYGPPGLVVDANFDIHHFRGQTGQFVSPAPGLATLNALKLVRPELKAAVRTLVEQALADLVPRSSEPIELFTEAGTPLTTVVDVLPLQEAGQSVKWALVVFRNPLTDSGPPRPAPLPVPVDARVQQLEHELLTTREYLQTSVDDLAAANEELQSANEELQSSNEELQSSNEELETSREELQSTNEELTTVNEELRGRMRDLSVASDDLTNLLHHSTSTAVLVDQGLKIRKFSSGAERLLHLIKDDLGRPVGYLGQLLNAPVENLVTTVVETNRARELRVQGPDGFWYTLRAVPYLTSENAVRGAVLDLTRAKVARPLEQPIEIAEVVGKVLSSLPHVLLLLDDQLRLVWANRAFFDTFLVGGEILGRSLEDLWNGRGSNPGLFAQLDATAAGGPPFQGVLVEHPFGREGSHTMKFGAHQIPSDGDRPRLMLVTAEEQ